jgi:hypothetical protein
VNLGSTIAATLGTVQTGYNQHNELKALIKALPSAEDVANAVLAAGGGGGLTRDQLVAVLNNTGLKVQEA